MSASSSSLRKGVQSSPRQGNLESVIQRAHELGSAKNGTIRRKDSQAKFIAPHAKQSSIITVENTKELFERLANDRQLTSVTLSTHQKVQKFTQKSVEEVKISEKEVQELIVVLKEYENLRELNLSGNFDSALVAGTLVRSVNSFFLQTLNLSDNPLGCGCATELAAALTDQKIALKTLILRNTLIMHEGAREIGKALTKNTSLQTLDLGDNPCLESIDNCGTRMLAEALGSNQTLTSVSLDHCGLDQVSAYWIFRALETNTSLKTLNLSHNEIKLMLNYVEFANTETKGTLNTVYVPTSAVTLLSNDSLKSLNLSHNLLGDRDVTNLVGVLKGNGALTSLDLSGNKFSPRVAQLFLDVFTENTSLTTFNLDGIKEVAEGLCKVNAIMKEDEFSILYDNLAKNNKGRGSESTAL